MALRALAGDESMDLAQWWTNFQEVSEEQRLHMVEELGSSTPVKKKRRKKPKPPNE